MVTVIPDWPSVGQPNVLLEGGFRASASAQASEQVSRAGLKRRQPRHPRTSWAPADRDDGRRDRVIEHVRARGVLRALVRANEHCEHVVVACQPRSSAMQHRDTTGRRRRGLPSPREEMHRMLVSVDPGGRGATTVHGYLSELATAFLLALRGP
jgi:hypothetical protein